MSAVVFSAAQGQYAAPLLGTAQESRIKHDPTPLAYGELKRVIASSSQTGAPALGGLYDFPFNRNDDMLRSIDIHYTVSAITAGGDNLPAFIDNAGWNLATLVEYRQGSEWLWHHNFDTLWLQDTMERNPFKSRKYAAGGGMNRNDRVTAAAAAQEFFVHYSEFEQTPFPLYMANQPPYLHIQLNTGLPLINQISTTTGLPIAAVGATWSITAWEVIAIVENLNDTDRNSLDDKRKNAIDPRYGYPGLMFKTVTWIWKDTVVNSSDIQHQQPITFGAAASAQFVLLKTNADVAAGLLTKTSSWTSRGVFANGEYIVPLANRSELLLTYNPKEEYSQMPTRNVLNIPMVVYDETGQLYYTQSGFMNFQLVTDGKVETNFPSATVGNCRVVTKMPNFITCSRDGTFDRLFHNG